MLLIISAFLTHIEIAGDALRFRGSVHWVRPLGRRFEVALRFTNAAMDRLCGYEWSGNVRSVRVAPSGNILHVATYDSAGAFTEANFWITIR